MGYDLPENHHESAPAVGRITELNRDKQGIMPDPITGQGDARELPHNVEIADQRPDWAEKLGVGADGGGKRMNKGKNKMELTPPEWEWALADVTTQGSKKYDERNWEQGMPWSTMVGCMKRHVNKFLAGERYDGDEFDLEKGTTGCHHLAMVAWNALALMSYDLREIGENDLPKDVQLELFDRVNNATSDMGNDIHVPSLGDQA